VLSPWHSIKPTHDAGVQTKSGVNVLVLSCGLLSFINSCVYVCCGTCFPSSPSGSPENQQQQHNRHVYKQHKKLLLLLPFLLLLMLPVGLPVAAIWTAEQFMHQW
jgi:hypothetical protein